MLCCCTDNLALKRQELVCNTAFGVACLRGNLFEYLLHYSPAITHAVNDYIHDVEKYHKVCLFMVFGNAKDDANNTNNRK